MIHVGRFSIAATEDNEVTIWKKDTKDVTKRIMVIMVKMVSIRIFVLASAP